MRQFLKRSIINMARRNRRIVDLASFIVRNTSNPPVVKDTYKYLYERFIRNGRNHPVDEAQRKAIIERFELIDKKVPIGSTPTDGLFLAEMLLNMKAEGALIECGCYAGGSSAKISIIAKRLGRELIIFDSFEGLPSVDQYYLRDQHCRRSNEWVTDWTKGRYAARFEEVQSNISEYGEPGVCRQVKGWFSESLTKENLPEKVAFAFVDVDLANSARDCLTAIWPRLSEGGIFVTHDTSYIKVLQEMYRPELWNEKLKTFPPVLFGAGFGLCNESPHLGYMVKGMSASSEYLKSLTIDK